MMLIVNTHWLNIFQKSKKIIKNGVIQFPRFSNRRIPDSSIIAESIINEVRRMDTGHFNSDLVTITYWAYDKLV